MLCSATYGDLPTPALASTRDGSLQDYLWSWVGNPRGYTNQPARAGAGTYRDRLRPGPGLASGPTRPADYSAQSTDLHNHYEARATGPIPAVTDPALTVMNRRQARETRPSTPSYPAEPANLNRIQGRLGYQHVAVTRTVAVERFSAAGCPRAEPLALARRRPTVRVTGTGTAECRAKLNLNSSLSAAPGNQFIRTRNSGLKLDR